MKREVWECKDCDGGGSNMEDTFYSCPGCGGTGMEEDRLRRGAGMSMEDDDAATVETGWSAGAFDICYRCGMNGADYAADVDGTMRGFHKRCLPCHAGKVEIPYGNKPEAAADSFTAGEEREPTTDDYWESKNLRETAEGVADALKWWNYEIAPGVARQMERILRYAFKKDKILSQNDQMQATIDQQAERIAQLERERDEARAGMNRNADELARVADILCRERKDRDEWERRAFQAAEEARELREAGVRPTDESPSA